MSESYTASSDEVYVVQGLSGLIFTATRNLDEAHEKARRCNVSEVQIWTNGDLMFRASTRSETN